MINRKTYFVLISITVAVLITSCGQQSATPSEESKGKVNLPGLSALISPGIDEYIKTFILL